MPAPRTAAIDGTITSAASSAAMVSKIATLRAEPGISSPSGRNVAAVGLLEAADDAQGGGLAAAGRTEQGHELAAFNVERDAPEHRGPVKFFFEVMQFDQAVSQLYHSPDRMQPQTERENGSIWGGNLILLFTPYRELCEMSRKCLSMAENGGAEKRSGGLARRGAVCYTVRERQYSEER